MSDDSPLPAGQKVADDVAEAEFERFGEAMDLDFDKSHMDEEDKKGFDDLKRIILRALKDGSLVVNDDGCPVYKPKHPDSGDGPITFNEPKGAALKETDKKKKGHDVGKTYAFAAAMTGENESRFSNMASRDLKVCLAIVNLFMGG
jgi:hypothetical protein